MTQTQTQTQTQHHSLTRTEIIHQLDQEVDRLLQARHLLAEGTDSALPAQPQPDAYAQISVSSGGTLTQFPPVKAQPFAGKAKFVVRPTRPRRKLSPAARRRISEAQKARWKKFHQARAKKSA